ncbi:hypothetical protein BUY27_08800 [Staphylococcus cohnii]|nr:hypothetical protein BUY27_08800 [Staphylococcus cohnii]
MQINEIAEKLEEFEKEMLKLKKRNRQLEELARAQQERLNNIYEASAKAQYEASLWRKRFEAVESYVALKLEMTPASAPYMRVMLELKELKKRELHELYQNSVRG